MATEYISREAAIKAVDFEITYLTAFNLATGEMTHPFEERNKGLMDGIEALKNVPTADVVEVVRCRDCRKRDICRTSTVWAVAPKDDWFCADGERMELNDR